MSQYLSSVVKIKRLLQSTGGHPINTILLCYKSRFRFSVSLITVSFHSLVGYAEQNILSNQTNKKIHHKGEGRLWVKFSHAHSRFCWNLTETNFHHYPPILFSYLSLYYVRHTFFFKIIYCIGMSILVSKETCFQWLLLKNLRLLSSHFISTYL